MSIFDFFKKEQCTDFVDLSIGRVYIKPLNNGIINNVAAKSTIYGSVLNNAVYFQQMEYAIVNLKQKQIDALSIPDGTTLRTKIKEILTRHNLIKIEYIESSKKDFSDSELKTFEEQEKIMIDRLRKKNA